MPKMSKVLDYSSVYYLTFWSVPENKKYYAECEQFQKD